jgi:hypothetical protein
VVASLLGRLEVMVVSREALFASESNIQASARQVETPLG